MFSASLNKTFPSSENMSSQGKEQERNGWFCTWASFGGGQGETCLPTFGSGGGGGDRTSDVPPPNIFITQLSPHFLHANDGHVFVRVH